MNLRRLLKKFIRVETMAVILYRMHINHVHVSVQPLFVHLAKREETHRDLLNHLYTRLFHEKPPRGTLFIWGGMLLASVLNLFGERVILRAECFIERHAIKEYTLALKQLDQPDIHRTLKHILQDERLHPSLTDLFHTFRKDEQEHLHQMNEILSD